MPTAIKTTQIRPASFLFQKNYWPSEEPFVILDENEQKAIIFLRTKCKARCKFLKDGKTCCLLSEEKKKLFKSNSYNRFMSRGTKWKSARLFSRYFSACNSRQFTPRDFFPISFSDMGMELYDINESNVKKLKVARDRESTTNSYYVAKKKCIFQSHVIHLFSPAAESIDKLL